MFPIRDHNPAERIPFVTYALIAANILIFLATWGATNDPRQAFALYDDWAMIPAQIMAGERYDTLITCMFLHGGIMHLAGNMLFLWIFGDNLEDQFGHVFFLGFYLLTGIAAGLAQLAIEPWSTVPTIGASGAIAGVMGGYLFLFPRAKVDVLIFIVIYVRVFTIPAFAMLVIWFGLQLFDGIRAGSASDIAYFAHIGGFVAGFLLCLPIWLLRGGRGFWSSTEGHPPHPAGTFVLTKTQVPRVRR